MPATVTSIVEPSRLVSGIVDPTCRECVSAVSVETSIPLSPTSSDPAVMSRASTSPADPDNAVPNSSTSPTFACTPYTPTASVTPGDAAAAVSAPAGTPIICGP